MRTTQSGSVSAITRAFLFSASLLVGLHRAEATPGVGVWDGGSGDWSTSVDLWDGGHKWVTNNSALLGGTSGTLTLRENIHVKVVEFASTGYTLAGTFQLDIKDGIVVDAGVTAATITAPTHLSKDQSWDVVTAGALLTVGTTDLSAQTLTLPGAGDVKMTSGFTGVGAIAKTGTGTLWLSGATSHTGATTVTDGVLKVTGAATSSPITLSVEGRLTGDGTVGALTVGDGGILSPGLSVGTLTAGNTTWQSGGYYNWQVADATGTAGTGYDQLVSSGTLTVASTPLSRFKINLWSLSGLVDGPPANFNPGLAYAWDIATFASVTGFDASRFLIVRGPSEGTGGFLPEAGGAFSLTSDGTHITLRYTPAAEPVWIDATGNWSDGTRWLGGSAPSNGAAIVYAGTGGTSTNDAYLASVAGIRFSAQSTGAYVVNGSALLLGVDGLVNDSAYAQTVAANLTLTGNSQLVTHTATLVVTGDIDTAGHALVVDGDHDTLVSGVISGDGFLYKLDHGRLTLSGANTYTGGTEATVGELHVDGSILGSVVIRDRAALAGTGTLSGDVAVAGVLAPGDSPGVLTQLLGDTTLLTGSSFVAEIGGVTPGAGDGFHDQYDIRAGTCTIQVGVTLEARGWDDALGAAYLTKRGDVFTLIRTSGGIVDTFGDLTNPDRAERVIFDNNSDHGHLYGNLYGTGLTGAQTLSAYAVNANQAAFAAALDRAAITASASSTLAHPAGFIDSTETEGRVVLAVLKGESLDAYMPEAYLGVTDHALLALRGAADAVLAQPGRVARAGVWTFTLAQGYLNTTRTGGSSAAFDRAHADAQTVVGATVDAGPNTTVGFFIGLTDGRYTHGGGRTDLSGSVHGITLVQRLGDTGPAAFKGCVAWADLDFTTVRQMNLGASGDGAILLSGATSTANDVPVAALSVQASLDIRLARGPGYAIGGVLGFIRGRSTLGAFTEAGTGANLTVSVDPEETSRGILGLNYAYLPTSDTSLTLSAGIERELGDPRRRLSASIGGEGFVLTDDEAARSTGLVGLTFVQQYAGQVSLQLTMEGRFNRDTSNDRRYNLTLSKRF